MNDCPLLFAIINNLEIKVSRKISATTGDWNKTPTLKCDRLGLHFTVIKLLHEIEVVRQIHKN